MKSASAESDGAATKLRQRIEQIKGQAMGLLGSKLTRLVVFTAVSTLLSDTVTRELKRFVSERFATPDAAMPHSAAS